MGDGEDAVSSVPVYGFLGWVTSAVAYVLYLVWAFVPNSTLAAYGITYYPSKYWAVALPTWFCVTVVAIYWVYESQNLMMTPPRAPCPPLDPLTMLDISNGSEDGSTQNGEEMPIFFSTEVDESILPVVELPPELVSLMTEEGLEMEAALAVYRKVYWKKRRKAGQSQ